MRLYELVSFEPRSSERTHADYRSAISSKTKSTVIGSGAFSTAHHMNSGKRLNQITKIGRTGRMNDYKSTARNIEDDGFLAYIKAIQGKNNPYFPKVYDLKLTKNKDGHLTYIVNMHKLVEFTSPKIIDNVDLITSLYDKMFYGRDYGYFSPDRPAKSLYETIIKAFSMPDLIKDKQLGEAIKIINELTLEYAFSFDLHTGNVMWRITGLMPQLVFLDPLA